MAGPTFENNGALATTASGTSLSPARPTPVQLGGVYIACVCSKNNAVHATATGGWSLLSQVNSGASFTASLWIAPSGSAAPTFTWTGAAAGHAQIAYYAPDANNAAHNGVSISGTTGTGTASPHTSTGFNTDANDALAIYVDACSVNTGLSTPAGWAEDADTGSATSATRQTFGSKSVATSGSASGNISVAGGAAAWVQFQIEIKNKAAVGGVEISKEGLLAWLEAPAGFDVAKSGVYAWLETNDVRFAKAELYAWLDGTASPSGGRRRMSLM